MIVIIGGKTIKGNIRIIVRREEEDIPVEVDGGSPPVPPLV